MKYRLYLPLILGILVLFVSLGCDSKSKVAKPSELFKNDQSETTTPHGTIDQDSVRDGGNGSVEYRTSDGKSWRTRMTTQGDGSRTWAEPERIEQSH